MTVRWALVSIFHLFVIFACLGVGLVFFTLATSPEWRVRAADAILYQEGLSLRLGFYCLGLSLVLSLLLFSLHRGKFIRFVMVRNVMELTEKVTRNTVQAFFKKSYPQFSLVDVDIARKSHIEMRVAIDEDDPEQVEKLLGQIEEELAALFYDRFGYKRSFVLSVNAKLL